MPKSRLTLFLFCWFFLLFLFLCLYFLLDFMPSILLVCFFLWLRVERKRIIFFLLFGLNTVSMWLKANFLSYLLCSSTVCLSLPVALSLSLSLCMYVCLHSGCQSGRVGSVIYRCDSLPVATSFWIRHVSCSVFPKMKRHVFYPSVDRVGFFFRKIISMHLFLHY